MLVLTRRVGEIIRIGDDIIIRNLGYKGDASRIGITAPLSVTVDRQEIYEKKFPNGDHSALSDLMQKPIQNPIDCKTQSNLKIDPKITIKKKRCLSPKEKTES